MRQRAGAKAFSLAIGGAFAEFGAASVLQPPVRLNGEERIAIGSGVFIGEGSWLLVPEPGVGVALRIGDGTAISDHHHAFEDPGRPVIEQGLIEARPVEIGDGAWLGENVVVCPGVTIGRGAVVGANAVVVSDVPAHSLAVGVPARVVRTFGAAET